MKPKMTLDKVIRYGAFLCTVTVTGIAVLAWLSWGFDRWKLTSFGEDFIPMAPGTALLMILLTMSTLLRCRWSSKPAIKIFGFAAIFVVVLISLSVLLPNRIGLAELVEGWLAPTSDTVGNIPVGRMSPLTALTFLLAATTLLFLLTPFERRRIGQRLARGLALVVILIGVIVLLGYASGVPLLYDGKTIPMALLTAVAFTLLGVALLLEGLACDPAHRQTIQSFLSMQKPSFPQFLIILFAILTAGIGISGYFYLRRQLADSRQTAQETLNAIAELKVDEIVRWRKEYLDDAMTVLESCTLADHFQELLANPADVHARDLILHSMTAMNKHLHYSRALLWDQSKQIRFAVPDNMETFRPGEEAFIAQTLHTNQVLLSDLHLDPPAPGKPCIDLYVPLIPMHPASADSVAPIGVLQLEIDPAYYLFPLIQSWPTPSRTEETLLLQRDGDSVLYLNELRHRKNTALRLRLPLTRTDVLSVRAVLGEVGLLEGVDYRNVPVFGALRSIPDSPWFMVAKVDKKEIYEPLKQQALITGFIVGILFLAAMMGTGLFWRKWKIRLLLNEIEAHEQKETKNIQSLGEAERSRAALLSILEDQREIETELRISEQRFRAISSNTPDHIVMQDNLLRYLFVVNPQLGLKEEDMIGKTDYDFLGKEDAEKLTKVKRQVLETGKAVHFETSLISIAGENDYFDGTYVPKYDARGQVDGLIGYFRNVTERKKSEEEIKRSHEQLEQLYEHLNEVREEERAIISREIHDELGQSLTALKIDLNWTRDNIRSKTEVAQKFENMFELVNSTIKNVQRISSELRPGILDDLGLAPAIEWYTEEFEKRTGIKCRVDLEDVQTQSPQKNLAIFRILQEALTNVIRHAKAKNVTIKLIRLREEIHLVVHDDGTGISKEKINAWDSLGLRGIDERTRQFHGHFAIESKKNNGTKLSVVIPV